MVEDDDAIATASPSASNTEGNASNLISAYFAIRFPNFTYYVKTLSCTIGRRSHPSQNLLEGGVGFVHVDIDLGTLKSVSRLHARIEFDEDRECFVICVLGRNGAWIDGVWAKSGSIVPLPDIAEIQIASRNFTFLLAPSPSDRSLSPSDMSRQCSPSSSKFLREDSALPSDSLVTSHTSPSVPPSLVELPIPIPELCYEAILARHGKATTRQITRWFQQQYPQWCTETIDWETLIMQSLSSDLQFSQLASAKRSKKSEALWVLSRRPRNPAPPQKLEDLSDSELLPLSTPQLKIGTPKKSVKIKVKKPPESTSVLGKRKLGESTKNRKPAASASPSPAPRRSADTNLPDSPSATGGKEEKRGTRKPLDNLDIRISKALQKSSANGTKQSSVRVPIRIAPRTEASVNLSSASKPQDFIQLSGQSIVLSPIAFGHITDSQLEALQTLDFSVVLPILQMEIKRFMLRHLGSQKKRPDPIPITDEQNGPLNGVSAGDMSKAPSKPAITKASEPPDKVP